MKKLLSIIFIIILNLCVLKAAVSNFRFEHMTTANGLSHNTVIEIMQDHQGFLWFGTLNGLDRYDGYHFTSYKPITGDSTSLSDNVINAIHEDSRQRLWVGTLNGLNLYNRSEDNFRRLTHDRNNGNSLIDNRVRCIMEDQKGIIWIGTEGGVSCYDPVEKQFENFVPDSSKKGTLQDFIIHDIYEDNRKQIWIATELGLNKYNRITDDFDYYPYRTEPGLPNAAVMCLQEDRWGNIWVGTWNNGLQRLDIATQKIQPVEAIDAEIITDIHIDNANRMWICSYDKGLFVLPQIYRNLDDKSFSDLQNYTYDEFDDTGINSNELWTVFEDETGLIWLGNENAGINKCNPAASHIRHYRAKIFDTNSLSNNRVTGFYEDESGKIWIGTRFGGLNTFDPQREKFEAYRYDAQNVNSIASNMVVSLAGTENYLWIGTGVHGLDRMDRHTGEITHFRAAGDDPTSISSDNIYTLFKDSRERVWIGSWGGGLSLVNDNQESFTNYPIDKSNTRLNVVTTIAEDTSGGLWLGTYGKGLAYFEPKTGQMRFYQHDEKNSGSIGHNNINTLLVDENGRLWISTMGAGINRLDKFNRKSGEAIFSNIDVQGELPDNIVEFIVQDNDGLLWLGTSHGVASLNPLTGEMKNFDSKDGFGQDVFIHEACLRASNGFLYFGGINGFNVFHPNNLQYNTHVPPVIITDFQIFNQSVEPGDAFGNKIGQSIFTADKITLTYKDNVFSFEFAALDFTSPERNQYAFKMEGFDNQWRRTDGDRNFVTYTNLPHGDYTFRVKGANNHNVWNEVGTSIDLVITAPFWKTNWMMAVYVGLIVGILLIIRRAVLTQERHKAKIEMEMLKAEKIHEVDQLKLSFFTHISHEFRTPLNLIIGPLERMLTAKDEISEEKRSIYYNLVLKNARRLLKLINQLMDARKLDTGSMKLIPVEKDFIAFAKAIYSVFHHRAERKNIDYRFISNPDSKFIAFDPDKVEKILYNLISNAMKFTGEGGEVTVKVDYLVENREKGTIPGQQGQVQVEVIDTGIGIEKEQLDHIFDPFYQVPKSSPGKIQGSGIGLSITRDFVKLHGGDIKVNSQLNTGSAFIFTIPENHVEVDKTEQAIPETVNDKDTENSDKPLILTVEDDKDLRQYLKMEIEDHFNVIHAPDGLSGFELATEKIPDLIISDVNMPVMNGYDLCRRCKQDQRTSHIPVILLTAYTNSKKKKEGFAAGADDYITKPFNPEMLKLRINNLLKTRKKLQDQFGKMVYSQPKNIPISSPDEEFLKKILDTVENYISDTGFSVDDLSYQVGLSRAQLYRKMKALFSHSPSTFIRNYRLERGMQLLEKGHTPSQVCYQVGFRDPSYFTKCFKKKYGKTPQQVLNEAK